MPWVRPAESAVWQAIEAYLGVAYDGELPAAVGERLERLRACGEAAFYDCPSFEIADDQYALRLGNQFYAHMKLVVLGAPDGRSLFRVDTHDRHFLALAGGDDPRLAELMARNDAMARAIEGAWEALGLATWPEHLRSQLAARRAPRP